MNVIIRADASRHIGYGHIMRCLTLAEELKKNNAEVNFICRKDEGNLISYIESKGHIVHSLPSGLDIEEDCLLTKGILKKLSVKPEYLIIDHYGINNAWEALMKDMVHEVMVIDDDVKRPHQCDIILNQNYGIEGYEYDGLVPHQCKRLTGSNYALLREDFCKVRTENRKVYPERAKNIFIFFGATDPTDETSKALDAITLIQDNEMSINVLVGNTNKKKDYLEKRYSGMVQAKFCSEVYDIAPLIASCDIALAAGGTNTWERCCIGLPSVVVIQAENQRRFVKELEKCGAIKSAGWYADVTVEGLAATLNDIIINKEEREHMGTISMKIIDGMGASRVVKEMCDPI